MRLAAVVSQHRVHLEYISTVSYEIRQVITHSNFDVTGTFSAMLFVHNEQHDVLLNFHRSHVKRDLHSNDKWVQVFRQKQAVKKHGIQYTYACNSHIHSTRHLMIYS